MRTTPWTLAVVLAVAACSPVDDWREVRPAGSGALLLFPCKPTSLTRSVVLAGAPVELTLLACAAGPTTYALTHGDVVDPARVSPALQALAASAAANVGAEVAAGEPSAVPGMTPNPQARRWALRGRLPDGTAVAEEVLTFAKGTRVFQATVIGPAPAPEAVRVFFEGVKLPS